MAWSVETSKQVTDWLERLDDASFDQIMPALDALEAVGPTLGRPLVDLLQGSRHHNMKELRSVGRSIRILFALDPNRRAILLVGGDKGGRWRSWYEANLPVADDLFDRHLAGERI